MLELLSKFKGEHKDRLFCNFVTILGKVIDMFKAQFICWERELKICHKILLLKMK